MRAPGFVKATETELDAVLDGEQAVSSVILAAATKKGQALDACAKLEGFAAAAADDSPLAAAIAALTSAHGGNITTAELAAKTAGVPLELQKALVPVIAALSYAASEMIAAVGTTQSDELDWLELAHGFVIVPTSAWIVDKTQVALLGKLDQPRISAAAALVARAVEQAKLEAFAGKPLPAVAIDTPIGAIVLGGPGADQYVSGELAERSALLLDVGGDDTYEVPVGAGRRDVPVSLAIDLGGNDKYGYEIVADGNDAPTRPPSDAAGRAVQFGVQGQTLSRVGRQGSGVLGIGLLWDRGAGNDTYASSPLAGRGLRWCWRAVRRRRRRQVRRREHQSGSALWALVPRRSQRQGRIPHVLRVPGLRLRAGCGCLGGGRRRRRVLRGSR
ncbi:MAG: hypothetical protein IPI67_13355 [Myxococcales bacterium]|nr:hypothetical protein [Myxococcales bacterium]